MSGLQCSNLKVADPDAVDQLCCNSLFESLLGVDVDGEVELLQSLRSRVTKVNKIERFSIETNPTIFIICALFIPTYNFFLSALPLGRILGEVSQALGQRGLQKAPSRE